MPILVRPARADDVPVLVAMMRELAAFEKLPGPDDEAARRLLADFGRRYHALVAVDGGRAVAYAVYYETYSNFRAAPVLWLEDLYVKPEARRKGAARELLAAVEREAMRRGCAKVAWAVLDWNVEAQRFYESVGASRRPWLWFEKDISPAGDTL